MQKPEIPTIQRRNGSPSDGEDEKERSSSPARSPSSSCRSPSLYLFYLTISPRLCQFQSVIPSSKNRVSPPLQASPRRPSGMALFKETPAEKWLLFGGYLYPQKEPYFSQSKIWMAAPRTPLPIYTLRVPSMWESQMWRQPGMAAIRSFFSCSISSWAPPLATSRLKSL